MPRNRSSIVSAEAFGTVSGIRREEDGTFLLTFLDGGGGKYHIRITEQVARDICDELNESLA